MALQKQTVKISFAQGLDTKSDPWQIPIGKFLALNNSVFNKGGLLQKRNGFGAFTTLPDATSTFLTTFNGNLTALGTKLLAYNASNKTWLNKGSVQACKVSTLPVIRNRFNQTQCDSALAANGLLCTVFTETDIASGGGTTTNYYYSIDDSVTGQNIVAQTQISTPSESPRVFLLGSYFVILFSQSANLNYIAVPVGNPSSPANAVTIVSNYAIGGTQGAFAGVVYNNNLYISYNASDGGGAIRATFLNANLARQTASTGSVIASAKSATMISVTADTVNQTVWTFFYKTSGTVGYVVATDDILGSVLAATSVISSGTILNVTLTALSGICTIFYEVSNTYSFDTAVVSNFINTNTITQAGAVGSATTLVRSVGLASNAIVYNAKSYFFVAYTSPYQPSYFLIDGSGNIISRVAYENGGGYLALNLPSITLSGSTLSVPYLLKDFISAINKGTNLPTGTQVAGIYSQTGIYFGSFNLTTQYLSAAEIGSNLNFTGGFLWAYDGYKPVEQNFFLYPDSDPNLGSNGSSKNFSFSSSGGSISTQTYYYQFIYSWMDQEGNIFRSAPSIPVVVNSADLSGSSNTITIKIPSCRLTYKTNVQLLAYRWSTAQQEYYQLPTSILNAATIGSDFITIVDTASDATILGNALIYTTGGVVEDIGPPGFDAVCLFKSRLLGIESEDPNTLWFSKQVISATPVEMSDLFTIYTAPTTGAQGSTGPNACIFPMDDKVILFKRNTGVYYITGNGPDNTGANNDFSDPVFITSTVGCSNQASIVLVPSGLMFQDGTGKGIWLLGRDLSTQYIGAPVEQYNNERVTSAFAIPGTNQVRFTLSSGTILTYDYYYGQWSTFSTFKSVSSCLFNQLHTLIDIYGAVYQETPGIYLDGSSAVTMSFTTGWISLSGLQSYARFYDLYVLGQYYSPHKLAISLAYDFNPASTQQSIITPLNFNANWGGDQTWGQSTPWGGSSQLERWQVSPQKQECESFQVTLSEIFDSSYGAPAGVGLTLSNMTMRVGLKKNIRPIKAANSVG